MGKVTWGGDLDAKTIDKADRSQFKPYGGPKVPDGLYCWRIKGLKRGKSSNKNDQVLVGLELVPRASRPDEKPYAGFYITDYITLTEAAAFRVASFTDAIGVTGADLISRTKDTGEKDRFGSVEIVSIGPFKHDKKNLVLAQLATDTDPKSKSGRKISGYWSTEALNEEPTGDADEDDDDEDEDEADDAEADDAEAYTREELKEMKLKDLKVLYLATCEEEGEDPEDVDDIKKGALIDLYLALVEDEDEDDSDDEDDEDDTEPEAEPEPPKKAAGKKAGKKAPAEEPPAKGKAKKSAKGKTKASEDEDENAPF